MKKRFILLVTAAVLLVFFMAVPASAYGYYDDYYYDDYYYDDYDDDSGMGIGEVFIVSIVAGVGISFVLVCVKKSAMKTVKPEKTAGEYVIKDSLTLTSRDDVFIREHTTRTPRQRNNR